MLRTNSDPVWSTDVSAFTKKGIELDRFRNSCFCGSKGDVCSIFSAHGKPSHGYAPADIIGNTFVDAYESGATLISALSAALESARTFDRWVHREGSFSSGVVAAIEGSSLHIIRFGDAAVIRYGNDGAEILACANSREGAAHLPCDGEVALYELSVQIDQGDIVALCSRGAAQSSMSQSGVGNNAERRSSASEIAYLLAYGLGKELHDDASAMAIRFSGREGDAGRIW